MKEYDGRQRAFIAASMEQSLKKRCAAADDIDAYPVDQAAVNACIEQMTAAGMSLITIEDAEYPQQLKELFDPPAALYVKGDISLLKSECVTVVGTRRNSRYGAEVTEYFAKGLAEKGVTVVSGLARGVDARAHKAALDCGGKTIAVLACGLDVEYPPENAELMRKIAGQGLLVSEYPPKTPPMPFRFPERNRLMGALGRGVLVTEAPAGSGSLITADQAVELGRELWIVPGSIFSRMSEGCNERLKECGRLVTRVGDIIADEGGADDGQNRVGLTEQEQKIKDVVEHEGDAHYSKIAAETGMSIAEVAKLLMKMEFDGILKRTAGNYYHIAGRH